MIVSFLWLLVTLLILAGAWFGLRWLVSFLGIDVPEMVMRILAAIFIIIGAIFIIQWILTIHPISRGIL